MVSKKFQLLACAMIAFASLVLPACSALKEKEGEGTAKPSSHAVSAEDMKKKNASEHFRRAHDLLRAGDLDGAQQEVDVVLSLDPDHPAPHLLAGDIFSAKGELVKAVQAYQKAEQKDRTKALPHAKLGEVSLKSGLSREALEAFETAVELEPEVPALHRRLGELYRAEGMMSQSEAEYRKAEALSKGPDAGAPSGTAGMEGKAGIGEDPEETAALKIMRLGDEFMKDGLMTLAVEQYAIAVRLRPRDALARQKLGDACLRKGALPEAARQYEKAIELKPRIPLGYLGLGTVYSRMFRVDEAVRVFEQGLSIAPDLAVLHFEFGLAYYKADRLDEAILELEKAAALESTRPQPRELLERVRQERAAEQNFESVASEHFLIKHGPLQDPAFMPKTVAWLEEAYDRLARELSFRPEKKIIVKIYPDLKAFHDAASTPEWFYGGIASAKDCKMLLATPKKEENIRKFPQVIAHELTHVFTNFMTHGNQPPAWFHEGMAVYLSGEWNEQRKKILHEASSSNKLFRLRDLQKPFVRFKVPWQTKLAYAQSFSLVEFIVDAHGKEALRRLIITFSGGKSFDEASAEVLGTDAESLEAEWIDTLRKNPSR